MKDKVIVVWCDSPSGLISTRVNKETKVLQFESTILDFKICYDEESLFNVLRRKDGTKVGVPISHVQNFLGWEV